MDDSSFKALNIVINENSNNFINEWRNKSILWKNISKMLLNPNSMLSKIGSIIRLEQSYNLNECVLDKECLEFHNIYCSYEDLIEIIPELQHLGIHIVLFKKTEYPEYGEIIYMNWMKNLPEIEICIAKRYNRKIYYAKNCFMFPY
jgi:hypothetical protein|tara:strand:- start:606 stop:1043 length:438 start_codon:yes stop_codon:yes gene_type:complete